MAPGSTTDASGPIDRETFDRAARELRARAIEFARAPVSIKLAMLRECSARSVAAAPGWVDAALAADGLDVDTAGEKWLEGPLPLIRTLRLYIDALEQVARYGRPPLGIGALQREDGRFRVDLFPNGGIDKVLFGGFTGWALMQPGVDRAQSRRLQAALYHGDGPGGGVSLIAGASAPSCAPLLAVLSRLLVSGHVCLLQLAPSHAWLVPIATDVFAPMVEAGYLRIVCGDPGQARTLTHDAIDHVHLLGRTATYDAVMWGGIAADQRIDAKLNVPVTAHLGSVTPMAIAPYPFTDAQLRFQARNIASMVATGAHGYRCGVNLLVTASGWPQREQLLGLIGEALSEIAPRRLVRRGAHEYYRAMTAGRDALRTYGDGDTPWAVIPGIDAGADDALFTTEPLCPILGETSVGTDDPVDFLDAAVAFMNERVFGTLAASLVVPTDLAAGSRERAALERSLVNMRYGLVALNHWPALAFVTGTLPWGGHPSSTPRDIQSGVGWMQNTFMLQGVEKSILCGPLELGKPPVWFAGNRKAGVLAARMVKLEAAPPR